MSGSNNFEMAPWITDPWELLIVVWWINWFVQKLQNFQVSFHHSKIHWTFKKSNIVQNFSRQLSWAHNPKISEKWYFCNYILTIGYSQWSSWIDSGNHFSIVNTFLQRFHIVHHYCSSNQMTMAQGWNIGNIFVGLK